MDGVLTATEKTRFKILQKILKKYNIDLPDSTLPKSFGVKTIPFLSTVVGDQLTLDQIKEIRLEKQRIAREKPEDFVIPYPGAVETIKKLSNYRKVLASNSSLPTIELILKHLGLLDDFEIIVSSDDVTHVKPDPEIYNLAQSKLNIDNSECIIIEDSIPGLKAAKASHIRCIAVAQTNKPEQLIGANIVVAGISGIIEALEDFQ